VEKADALKLVADEIAVCQACTLHETRKNTVPGAGSANTDLMLIGEGPGYYENEQGLPFVGASGKFLTHLIEKAGFDRKDVFITNVVKCRPPENRDPHVDELTACAAYLNRQIDIINPEVIVTLGRFSMAKFFQNVRISKVHGKAGWIEDRLIVPMYHPAAALHNPRLRPVVEADFAKLPALIEYSRRKKEEKESQSKENQAQVDSDDQIDDDAVQLTLFS
jgi:uracil-DNA glycosylase family 4